MNRVTVFLLAGVLCCLSGFPADRLIRGGNACTLENAYADTPGDFIQYQYVTVISTSDSGTRECDGTLIHRYNYTINSASCQPGFGSSSGFIWGNGLSGTYRIDLVDGNCLKLCACE